jgi:hypothetical protein
MHHRHDTVQSARIHAALPQLTGDGSTSAAPMSMSTIEKIVPTCPFGPDESRDAPNLGEREQVRPADQGLSRSPHLSSGADRRLCVCYLWVLRGAIRFVLHAQGRNDQPVLSPGAVSVGRLPLPEAHSVLPLVGPHPEPPRKSGRSLSVITLPVWLKSASEIWRAARSELDCPLSEYRLRCQG